MIEGSVLSEQNRGKLITAWQQLHFLKNAKLRIRHDRNAGESWEIKSLIEHLKEEIREYLRAEDYISKVQELADISNIVDIIFMAENEHERLL